MKYVLAIDQGTTSTRAILINNEGNMVNTLKALTRTNEGITSATIAQFIETLNVSDSVKEELRTITPATYTGL